MARHQTIAGPYHVVLQEDGYYEIYKNDQQLIPRRRRKHRTSAYRLMATLNREYPSEEEMLISRPLVSLTVPENMARIAHLQRYQPLGSPPWTHIDELQHCQILSVDHREVLTTSYNDATSFLQSHGYHPQDTLYDGQYDFWQKGEPVISEDGERSYYLTHSPVIWDNRQSPGNCDVRCAMSQGHAARLGLRMEKLWIGIVGKESDNWAAMSLSYQMHYNDAFQRHVSPEQDNPRGEFSTQREAIQWLIETNEMYALSKLQSL